MDKCEEEEEEEQQQQKEEEEEVRRRKYEEALEVKSLRRIISAFLNYTEAAEEDLKRYERSFRRLPAAHKALLSHLPSKYRKLRRCISKNSIFIFEMLKAFEPPLDMSQDAGCCDHVESASCGHFVSRERNGCSSESASISGRVCSPKVDEAWGGEESNLFSGSLKMVTGNEEKDEKCNESIPESCHVSLECNVKADKGGGDDISNFKDHEMPCSVTEYSGDIPSSPPYWLDSSFQLHVPLVDVDKVRCVIRNIVRDWAAEGQKERDQCYKPILQELERQFPDRSSESPPACLVPGAGLGRLALEISSLGFISQGNEFSYYMMMCSSFILNHSQTVGEWIIHPWIHSNCNSLADSDQLRPVLVPDIHPASAGITEGFSMCGGDFVEVYSDPSQVGAWDAIVTCFFLDTAHNIVEYIEIISRVLKEGGVWINLGPLLYHFADMYGQEDEISIELSLEDVKRVAFHYGFQLEIEKTIETTYTTNPRSMMQLEKLKIVLWTVGNVEMLHATNPSSWDELRTNHYFSAFWTMRKTTKKK